MPVGEGWSWLSMLIKSVVTPACGSFDADGPPRRQEMAVLPYGEPFIYIGIYSCGNKS